MLTLQAATAQLENLDFEEWYLLETERVKRKMNRFCWKLLSSIREKRLAIYKNTYIK